MWLRKVETPTGVRRLKATGAADSRNADRGLGSAAAWSPEQAAADALRRTQDPRREASGCPDGSPSLLQRSWVLPRFVALPPGCTLQDTVDRREAADEAIVRKLT